LWNFSTSVLALARRGAAVVLLPRLRRRLLNRQQPGRHFPQLAFCERLALGVLVPLGLEALSHFVEVVDEDVADAVPAEFLRSLDAPRPANQFQPPAE
jgi:hypothetical protein